MYAKFIKRILDFFIALTALLVLSPVLVILTVLGAIKMKGNPFFTQLRPGRKEKIFRLLKFRTMTCEKDENGKLLPDDVRLTKYGRFLRSTSLDELPEVELPRASVSPEEVEMQLSIEDAKLAQEAQQEASESDEGTK